MFIPPKKRFLSREIRGGTAAPVSAFLAAAALATVGLAYAPEDQVTFQVKRASREVAVVTLPAIHRSAIMDIGFFDEAYAEAKGRPVVAPADARGAVVPHHLLAAPIIASAFDALAGSAVPERIVIVAPDHLGRSKYPATVSEAAWETPYGLVMPDSAAIASLRSEVALPAEEGVFEDDASVSALMPFVARSFPDAEVVPIMVNGRLTASAALRIAAAIPADAKTLVIASVDFSHYQPERVAGLHDATAVAALSASDVVALEDLDVDSSESLAVFLGAMSAQGSQAMTLLARSTSEEFVGAPQAETTSYVIAAFAPGAPAERPPVVMLAVGDMMFDRETRVRMSRHGSGWPFEAIKGKEGRFFRGLDLTTGNLEGAISERRAPEKEIDFAFDDPVAGLLAGFGFDAVNLANNHALDQGRAGADDTAEALESAGIGHFGDQVRDDTPAWTTLVRGRRVAMLGFDSTVRKPDEAAVEATVRAAKAANDLVVVSVHWGAEYKTEPTSGQRGFGRKLVEWGADAVIGTHPHVMEGMEVWQGKPIFWSLGNFIFDQDWSAETERGLAVGLTFGGAGIEARLFPVSVIRGQAKLLAGEAESRALADFAARSDLDPVLREQASKGIINIGNKD